MSAGAEGRPLLSSQTGRRLLPPDAGARLGGGSSFHFLSNVIAGACARPRAARPRRPRATAQRR
jgi:hypothetical protein